MISTVGGDGVLEAIGGLKAIASIGDAASIPSAVGMIVVQARIAQTAPAWREERHLLAALVILGESWLAEHRRTGRAGVRPFARTCSAFESLGGSPARANAPRRMASC
ncbi:MAG TPA: hypothetical protein VFR93_11555 [Candidatus Limnocylindrales bacterium]|nr:hypothetical protein [Candidatus Limnocylindrales bacterium]